MSDHTPGPWRLAKRKLGLAGYQVEAPNGRRSMPTAKAIATCRPYPGTNEARVEAKANACLIAASTEMLTELKQLLSDLCSETRGKTPRTRQEQIAAICAVIAKTEFQS